MPHLTTNESPYTVEIRLKLSNNIVASHLQVICCEHHTSVWQRLFSEPPINLFNLSWDENTNFLLKPTLKKITVFLQETVFFTYILTSFLRLTVNLHENIVQKPVKISLLLGNYRNTVKITINCSIYGKMPGNRTARYFPVKQNYGKIPGNSIANIFRKLYSLW